MAVLATEGVGRRKSELIIIFRPTLVKLSAKKKKVLITPQTSYAISLMLTHFRFTLSPSYIEHMMSIKNDIEIDGMRRAYLRDGVSFVRSTVHQLFDGFVPMKPFF